MNWQTVDLRCSLLCSLHLGGSHCVCMSVLHMVVAPSCSSHKSSHCWLQRGSLTCMSSHTLPAGVRQGVDQRVQGAGQEHRSHGHPPQQEADGRDDAMSNAPMHFSNKFKRITTSDSCPPADRRMLFVESQRDICMSCHDCAWVRMLPSSSPLCCD